MMCLQGAKSMSQELTLDGANNLDGSPPEHMANLDCGDISMSRSICRHAIWHSSAYWVYVLEQNFNESATQLHQNDDDPSTSHLILVHNMTHSVTGEVRFVHLNKVVQLMLTLQVFICAFISLD